jgi:hemoglobin/transferrin/lactoferrin receptor protein
LDSSLVFNGGLRYTRANLYSEFSPDSIIFWPQFYLDGISNTHSDLTWSGGLTYSTKSKFQARLMASKAFRSPNLDDFSKIREQNNIVTIPNPFLKPETSLNYELSLSKQFGGIRNGKGLAAMLSATGYYTSLKNLMVRRRYALPDGSMQLVMGGDTLSTVANVNAATGFIYGSSFNLEVNFGSRIKLSSDLTFTKGKENFRSLDDAGNVLIDSLVPASHIPPTYGQTSLSFTGKKFSVTAAVRYQGRKPVSESGVVNIYENEEGLLVAEREGGSDNIELGYTELGPEGELNYVGMLANTTYNLYTSWQFAKNYSLNFSVENITDLHYRQFASGVSAPGRNFIVSLRAKLGK